MLRWPGGCFADGYHWEDGVGPRDQRPVRVAHPCWAAPPKLMSTGDLWREIQREPDIAPALRAEFEAALA